jgi:hypothetical protein
MTSQELHYIMGSGSHGCLYDQSGAYESLADAVQGAADLFQLGRDRARALKRGRFLYLNPRRDGASYVEVIPCACDNVDAHNDDAP